MPESAPSSSVVASPEAVCSSAAPTSIPALSRAEVRELLFDLPWPELQALAHQCRLRHKGRHVHVRGLLEFSNVCRRNCRYCGLRHENRAVVPLQPVGGGAAAGRIAGRGRRGGHAGTAIGRDGP